MKTIIIFLLTVSSLTATAQVRTPYKKRLPTTGVYRIAEIMTGGSLLFKKDDVLDVSLRYGLRHYRAGQLKGTYKIIPDTITVKRVAPCLVPPCPEFLDVIPVFYMGHINKFIAFNDLENRAYLEAYDPAIYRSRSNEPVDRYKCELLYVLKKVKNK